MIEKAVLTSLMITALFVAFQQGNVLSFVKVKSANWIDKVCGKVVSRYVQKPLWDCLPCMASFWSIILTFSFDIKLILAVCGINVLIERLAMKEEAL